MTLSQRQMTDNDRSQFDFHDDIVYLHEAKRGLTRATVEEISAIKDEPDWMLSIRLRAYEHFLKRAMPVWTDGLDRIDFDNIIYYRKPSEREEKSWDDVPDQIKDTFERLGIPEAERNFLAGVGAQYDWRSSTTRSRRSSPRSAWSSWAPTRRSRNTRRSSRSTSAPSCRRRTTSSPRSTARCGRAAPSCTCRRAWRCRCRCRPTSASTARTPASSSARSSSSTRAPRCTTSRAARRPSTPPTHCTWRWSRSSPGRIARSATRPSRTGPTTSTTSSPSAPTPTRTPRSSGSTPTPARARRSSTPASTCAGAAPRRTSSRVAVAGKGQHQDTGAKAIHLAPDTKSRIVSKSVSKDGGRATYRGQVKVAPGATNVVASVRCDALMLDDVSRSDTYPYIDIQEDDTTLTHEATVGKISEDQIFYLMSRGLTENEAQNLDRAGLPGGLHQGAADGIRHRVQPPGQAGDGGRARLSIAPLQAAAGPIEPIVRATSSASRRSPTGSCTTGWPPCGLVRSLPARAEPAVHALPRPARGTTSAAIEPYARPAPRLRSTHARVPEGAAALIEIDEDASSRRALSAAARAAGVVIDTFDKRAARRSRSCCATSSTAAVAARR